MAASEILGDRLCKAGDSRPLEVDHIGSPRSRDHSVSKSSMFAVRPDGCNAVTCTSLARSEGIEPPTF